MRAIWKGSISFGLVNIPVNVCGAVEAKQVSFHQVHKSCKGRIKYRKYCPYREKEVPNHEIVKGYKTPGGIITVTDDDLAEVSLGSLKTIELAGFIKEKEVDPLFYQKPYYLLPEKSDQPYWLLYHALKKTGRVGIARFAVHSREHLALVRPAKGILTLCTLYYPNEIREVEGAAPVYKPRLNLIATSTSDILSLERDPSFLSNLALSIVRICARFTALSFSKPPSPALRRTMKG